jgi:autotransporter-associated beta strand protein
LNRSDDFTISGNIVANFAAAQNNRGIVQQNGTGRMTLTGNNTYGGGTVIAAGIVQVGNGGSTGSLGTGPVTDNSQLVFNSTGTVATGNLTGTGSVTNLGPGIVTLSGNSTIGGYLDLQGGTFGAAPSGIIGSVSVTGDMNIASGVTVLAGVNRLQSPSNSVYTVSGAIHNTAASTLKVVNGGPALQVGDRFVIFNQIVTGMSVVSPGYTFHNDLATDGSVTVQAFAPAPTLTNSVSGAGGVLTLTLSWDAAWIGGVHLQAQTNALTVGLRTANWVSIPNTDLTNIFTVPIARTNGSVFYRLSNP